MELGCFLNCLSWVSDGAINENLEKIKEKRA
jgi:hypothetical protein